jgi:hypothetical protein
MKSAKVILPCRAILWLSMSLSRVLCAMVSYSLLQI